VKYRRLFEETDTTGDAHWNRYLAPDGSRHTMSAEQLHNHKLLPDGAEIYQLIFMSPAGSFDTGLYEFTYRGKKYSPPPGRSWKTPIDGMRKLALANRLEPYAGGATLRYVLKLNDYPVSPIHNMWGQTPPPSDKTYVVQTSHKVIERASHINPPQHLRRSRVEQLAAADGLELRQQVVRTQATLLRALEGATPSSMTT